MRRSSRLGRALALPLLLTALAGCSDDDDPQAAASARSDADAEPVGEPPYPVGSLTETFVDTSRPAAGGPARPLETTVRYPDVEGRSFPLVVFAHGFLDHPRAYSELTTAWSAAGYVVAAPVFPRTQADAGAPDPADLVNQPADVSFVIDEVAGLAGQPGHELDGRVDLERVGVAGHGLGMTTVLGPVANTCCRDDRVDAALALSGILLDLEGDWEFSDVPLMVLFGDADEYLPQSAATDLYDRAERPKFLVTITGATHYPAYRDEPHPADEAVVAATTDFLDHFVAGNGPVGDLLESAAVDGVTTLEHDVG